MGSFGEGTAFAVAVVGRSGAGKTTLIEDLLPALRARGLRVGAVKHASHGFAADRPGKDSHRIYEAGAQAVAVVSRAQVATFVRAPVPEQGDPRLAPVLAALPAGLDLVLVEGFSWEPVPRLVVVPDGELPVPAHTTSGPLLEVVAAPPERVGVRPEFAPARVAALARRLARLARVSRCFAAAPSLRRDAPAA